MKNATLLFNSTATSVPTDAIPVLKGGLEWNCSKIRSKVLTNLRNSITEHHLTYLAHPRLVVGYNVLLNLANQGIEKYDFGLSWQVGNGAFLGLRHDSLSKDELKVGKILFNLHHNISSTQSVGTEVTIHPNGATDFRLGLSQNLNDTTSLKVKVNHNGHLEGALKHKVNSLLTLGVVSSVDFKRLVTSHKTSSIPLGFSADFKF